MANKTRAWRPDDGFYQAIREKAGEGLSDHELVQMMAVQWLGSQSVTLPTNGESQSVTLTDLIPESTEEREGFTLLESLIVSHIDRSFNDLQPLDKLEELEGKMRQLQDLMMVLRGEVKALKESSGFI